MKIKSILFSIIMLLIVSLSGCKPSTSNNFDKDFTVNEILDISSSLKNGVLSNEKYVVSGYVIDEPTLKNDLNQVSFTICDDLNNQENKITVFAAKSNETIKKNDKVTLSSPIRKYNNNSVIMMGNLVEDDDECKVISVIKSTEEISLLSTSEVSVLQYSTFLKGKQEHYPISDEFMEKYQQTSGGYIENAKKAGIEVNRQKHSPNQKWHFFVSWFEPSIEEGTFTLEDNASSKIYSKLLCPELLLWMYEASGVDPIKVRHAMDIAIKAKVDGTHISTMAKNMRAIVSWEDIVSNLGEQIVANNVILDKTNVNLNLNETTTITATVSPTNTTQSPSWSIIDGEEFIILNQNGNQVTIQAIKEGVSTIKISYNSSIYAQCIVNVIDNEIRINGLPESLSLNINDQQTLKPYLNKGESEFTYKSNNKNVVSVNNQGVITANSVGNAIITITSSFYSDVYTTINVKVKDPSINKVFNYDIIYDQGNRVTAKVFENTTDLLNTFVLNEQEEGIIESISDMQYIYGGASGGRNDTAWNTGDIIKFGTTSVNGSMTLNLSQEVNYIKITGYVYATSCKIQAGDSTSLDWQGQTLDNKTTTVTGANMSVASKETIEANTETTIIIKFTSTDSLKIAITNQKPLFIKAIELGYEDSNS